MTNSIDHADIWHTDAGYTIDLQHISEVSDKSAFALALAPLWDDRYHNAIGAAAQLLVTENMGHYKYTMQYSNYTTLWRHDVLSSVRLTVSAEVDGVVQS